MSINRINLPGVEVLENHLKENGSKSFFNLYVRKRDAFIGSDESINFIEHFCKEYFKDDSQETV